MFMLLYGIAVTHCCRKEVPRTRTQAMMRNTHLFMLYSPALSSLGIPLLIISLLSSSTLPSFYFLSCLLPSSHPPSTVVSLLLPLLIETEGLRREGEIEEEGDRGAAGGRKAESDRERQIEEIATERREKEQEREMALYWVGRWVEKGKHLVIVDKQNISLSPNPSPSFLLPSSIREGPCANMSTCPVCFGGT